MEKQTSSRSFTTLTKEKHNKELKVHKQKHNDDLKFGLCNLTHLPR